MSSHKMGNNKTAMEAEINRGDAEPKMASANLEMSRAEGAFMTPSESTSWRRRFVIFYHSSIGRRSSQRNGTGLKHYLRIGLSETQHAQWITKH